MSALRIDIHQHVWPEPFLAALRARRSTPRLDGWILHTGGEPPYRVEPGDHSVSARAELAAADGIDLALVSLSSPLGIESLPADQARPLLDAYHEGVLALPRPFRAWAAAGLDDPDPAALRDVLLAGCVGLQLPANAIADEAGYERCGPLLTELERRDKPLFVHPGPDFAGAGGPSWWAAIVGYVGQMHAAWFAWHEYGAPRYPRLRVAFAMLAGLAPLHSDRIAARGGPEGLPGAGVFVETSSYGSGIVDAVAARLGADRIVLGSDRPYASPLSVGAGDRRLRIDNPATLLGPQFPARNH
ncbi:amidohydrolase family protein [Rhodococcus zopfii]|uniref:amidohydrolase family protein n=1 Tax=Rhodococcus zopfii TaxID=43772 RepID=UPI000ADA7D75|nr:amidohydrolase [Rhodococcus zopfii]